MIKTPRKEKADLYKAQHIRQYSNSQKVDTGYYYIECLSSECNIVQLWYLQVMSQVFLTADTFTLAGKAQVIISNAQYQDPETGEAK